MSQQPPVPPWRQATNLEAFLLGGAGVLLAWAVLAAGWLVGYATTAVIGSWIGRPVLPLSWARFTEGASVVAVVMFAMGGFLIEALRYQGPPREGSYFRAWRAAGPLRLRLYLLLGAGAVLLGLLAGR